MLSHHRDAEFTEKNFEIPIFTTLRAPRLSGEDAYPTAYCLPLTAHYQLKGVLNNL
jgi:hypothetical protein